MKRRDGSSRRALSGNRNSTRWRGISGAIPIDRKEDFIMNDAAVVVRRVFRASRERLFRAWSDPSELIEWFSPEGYRNPSVDADVKPGGCFRIAMQKLPDEEPF